MRRMPPSAAMAAEVAWLPMVRPTPVSSTMRLEKISAPLAPPKNDSAEMPMTR